MTPHNSPYLKSRIANEEDNHHCYIFDLYATPYLTRDRIWQKQRRTAFTGGGRSRGYSTNELGHGFTGRGSKSHPCGDRALGMLRKASL